jgi:uncharacterized protein YoxC
MQEILIITQVVALLCLSALSVYVIVVLLRVRDILNNVEKDFKEMTTRAIPILENLEFITSRVKGITENIDDQVVSVKESLGTIRQMAMNVVELERRVQERVEGPVLEGVAVAAAIVKGVRTFLDRVRS